MPPTLSQVIGLLERRADPTTAEEWDRVGLVVGDPDAPVATVRFAVDPLPPIIDAAVSAGADLVVTHHPLLLRGVHSVAESTRKGRSLTQLIRAGCGLFTMHTNADQATDGVNDALADALGLQSRRPIRALTAPAPDRLVVYVPGSHVDAVIDALAHAGAGRMGAYDSCAYRVAGTGQFRPLPGSDPHIGTVGRVEEVDEIRVEMVVAPADLAEVVAALRRSHPYEEPAFSVVPARPLPGPTGIGRWGPVEPTTVAQLARRLAASLPAGAAPVRFSGPPDRPVAAAAVCGGAGDSLLPDVAALGTDGVDVYVTSDLRHHPATDFVADTGIALIDIPHASGEALWLDAWARQLEVDATASGWTVTATADLSPTDPWTGHVTPGGTHEG